MEFKLLAAWWDEHRPDTRVRVDDALEAAVAVLAEHPDIGRTYSADHGPRPVRASTPAAPGPPRRRGAHYTGDGRAEPSSGSSVGQIEPRRRTAVTEPRPGIEPGPFRLEGEATRPACGAHGGALRSRTGVACAANGLAGRRRDLPDRALLEWRRAKESNLHRLRDDRCSGPASVPHRARSPDGGGWRTRTAAAGATARFRGGPRDPHVVHPPRNDAPDLRPRRPGAYLRAAPDRRLMAGRHEVPGGGRRSRPPRAGARRPLSRRRPLPSGFTLHCRSRARPASSGSSRRTAATMAERSCRRGT